MQEIDLGFGIVLPTDALCSINDDGHDAVVAVFRTRLSSQVEVTTPEDLLRRW
jgi:nicotinamidase-related amidase